MTTIFEIVDTALAEVLPEVPFALAPYKGDLPDTYLAYQLIDSPPDQHADDAETARSYFVQVSVWCVTGLANTPDVDAAMISAGFIKRNERQLPQDRETGHYGLAKEYIFKE